MVTLAVGAGAGFQKATFPAVQRWVKNFFSKQSEKSDLLSMFAQTVRTPHASPEEAFKIEHTLEYDLD